MPNPPRFQQIDETNRADHYHLRPADDCYFLFEYRHGLSGWCLDCSALHRLDRRDNPPAAFAIDLDALIAERGAKASVIRMAPVPCPGCGGGRTEYRIRAPGKV